MSTRKLYVIPKSNSFIDSVIPTIYGHKEIELDIKKNYTINDMFKDNAKVFAIIDEKYYQLNIHNYTLDDSKIKETVKKSFTKEEIIEIANNTFKNYIKPKNDDDIIEIPETVEITISGAINGTSGEVVNAEITILVKNDKFKDVNQSDDVISWFVDESNEQVLTGSDITATVKENPTVDNTTVTVTITGTPSKAIDKATTFVKVPSDKLENGKEIKSKNSIVVKINEATPEPAAEITLSGGPISGTANSPVTGEIVATLTNDTYTGISQGNDVLSWLVESGNPALSDSGITATVKENPTSENTVLTITIAGTPGSELTKNINLKVPNNNLTKGTETTSTNTVNFNIVGAKSRKR